ncbi:MAG: betaine--homocysteine S-methyltransferase, partial [Pseudomonadota bacterium]
MHNPIAPLLEKNTALLLDGGIGTGLFARGLQSGDSPETWNLIKPEKIYDLHKEFIDAGSDVILTNSFGANRARLALHNAQDHVAQLCAASVAIAKDATRAASRTVLVAGSIGPSGEILEPHGSFGYADAVAVFRQQAQALAEAGADLLWVETMSSKEEILAACTACADVGMPYCATMTFDTVGYTMMGVSPADAYRYISDLDPVPLAMGANCGLGMSENAVSILQINKILRDGLLIIAKANYGIPSFRDGAFHYSGTPKTMAQYCEFVLRLGARLIGGCCGTTGETLRSMRAVIDNFQGGLPPTRDEIVATLGEPF